MILDSLTTDLFLHGDCHRYRSSHIAADIVSLLYKAHVYPGSYHYSCRLSDEPASKASKAQQSGALLNCA